MPRHKPAFPGRKRPMPLYVAPGPPIPPQEPRPRPFDPLVDVVEIEAEPWEQGLRARRRWAVLLAARWDR